MFAHQYHLLFLLLLAVFSLFNPLLILSTFLMKIAFLVLICHCFSWLGLVFQAFRNKIYSCTNKIKIKLMNY